MSDSSEDHAARRRRRRRDEEGDGAEGEEPSTSKRQRAIDDDVPRPSSARDEILDKAVAALPLDPLTGKLSKKKLKKLKKKLNKRGVVYMSRVPPNMRPQKVKHLLSDYGRVGRVYLAAEDASVRKGKRRSAAASAADDPNKKPPASRAPKRFVEGWIEFEDKRDAKLVATALNGQPVGGRPRSAHRHDLWCLRYLPKFSWDDLTEEVAAQNAARESRLAAEAAAAARERDFYLSKVDEAKGREAMARRRAARADKEGRGKGKEGVSTPATTPLPTKRTFKQNPVVKGDGGEGSRWKEANEAGSGKLSKATLALIAGRGGDD